MTGYPCAGTAYLCLVAHAQSRICKAHLPGMPADRLAVAESLTRQRFSLLDEDGKAGERNKDGKAAASAALS
jgi:hypothetical protein